MKQYRAVLLRNPPLLDPAISMAIDADGFDHATELAEKMADSIGYTVEQVSEV